MLDDEIKMIPIENNNISIKRDFSKCIQCKMCKDVCDNKITVGKMYDLNKTKFHPICINCGQCSNFCPTEAITEKMQYEEVKKAINDPSKVVIFNTAPAVRAALGEEFDKEEGTYFEEKMVGLIRSLGADYVLDITFGADLTIMEEASELVERIKENKNLPMFTSCCPSWIKYAEIFYPNLLKNISSVKSPISMQGSIIKTYFAKKMNINPEDIVNVVVAPCTAKKYEISRPEMNSAGIYHNKEYIRDNDFVITTRELAKWIKEEKIDIDNVALSEFDSPLGRGTGAGIIFGNTGGVTEAALRTAYYLITGEKLNNNDLEFNDVRGLKGIKEAQITIGTNTIKVAVANGMKNAKELIDNILAGKLNYHFIEIMNCEGGCISGGGQPKITLANLDETRRKRINSLYEKDKNMEKRVSFENPDIIDIYKEFLEKPFTSELSKKLLHTHYEDKSYLLNGN